METDISTFLAGNIDFSLIQKKLNYLETMSHDLCATDETSLSFKLAHITEEFMTMNALLETLKDTIEQQSTLYVMLGVDIKRWAIKFMQLAEQNVCAITESVCGENDIYKKHLYEQYKQYFRFDEKDNSTLGLRNEESETCIGCKAELSLKNTHNHIVRIFQSQEKNHVKEKGNHLHHLLSVIKKQQKELSNLLFRINEICERHEWNDRQYAELVHYAIGKHKEESPSSNHFVSQYRQQKKHEKKLTKRFLENKADEELAIFLKTDFLDIDYYAYDPVEAQQLWEERGLRSLQNCEDESIYCRRYFMLVRFLGTNEQILNFDRCGDLGRYIRQHYNELTPKMKYFKRFFVMSEEILQDVQKLEKEINAVTGAENWGVSDEEAERTGIYNLKDKTDLSLAKRFIYLVRTMFGRNKSGKTWAYVFAELKTNKLLGYDGNLKDFHRDIVKDVLRVNITYDAIRTARNRQRDINFITDDDTLCPKAYTDKQCPIICLHEKLAKLSE